MFVLAAMALGQPRNQESGQAMINAASTAAVGWGAIAGLWHVWIIWKVFTISTLLEEQGHRGGGRSDITLWPGPGAALGLICAFVIVVVFSFLLIGRKRVGPLLSALGMGAAIGFLLLVFTVKPWQELGKM